MKTSEFYKKIEELGLKLVNSWDGKDTCVRQNKHVVRYFVKLGLRDDYIHLSNNLKDLDKELRDELVAICMDYAFTPIEERKDDKKYYWKIKNENYKQEYRFLNKSRFTNEWCISDNNVNIGFETRFTEKEYKKMVEDSFIPDIFEKEEIDE